VSRPTPSMPPSFPSVSAMARAIGTADLHRRPSGQFLVPLDRAVGDALLAHGMTSRADWGSQPRAQSSRARDGMSSGRVRHYDVATLEVSLW
jgi:hypothetical protein